MAIARTCFSALVALFLCVTIETAHALDYPEVKLFIDADQSFVTKQGGTANATVAITQLIAQVDAIYRTQLGLTVTLAGLHLWTEQDPFDHSSQSALLADFASYGEAYYRSSYTYDVGHLLVGTGLGGEGGIAYPGAACGDVTSQRYAYGLSQPDLTDQYQFSPHLLAHELGHNLNADHDAAPACLKQTIMCVGEIGGSFSQTSRSTIASYVAARSSAGCFPTVTRTDPVAPVTVSLSYSGSTVKYQVKGGEGCSTLTLVSSPTIPGLQVLFAYLELGKLTPASTVTAKSRNALRLVASRNKLYVGAYCNGQLAPSVVQLKFNKIRTTRGTTSVVAALRSLKSGFHSP